MFWQVTFNTRKTLNNKFWILNSEFLINSLNYSVIASIRSKLTRHCEARGKNDEAIYLNKLKIGLATASAGLILFTTQTKAAVAETLSNEKFSPKTEEKADIQKATSHDLEANFYMEPDISYPDTNYIKEFFEPAFENAEERKEFYTIRNKATHSSLRSVYERSLLDMFSALKDDMAKTVITILVLDPGKNTNIWKRAYNVVSNNKLYQLELNEIMENIIKSKEIERLDKNWKRLDKEIKEWKEEIERLDNTLKILTNIKIVFEKNN